MLKGGASLAAFGARRSRRYIDRAAVNIFNATSSRVAGTASRRRRIVRSCEPDPSGRGGDPTGRGSRRGRVTVYVIDASAGADLLLDTANGRAIEDAVEPNAEWWVPEHYDAEVMSVLRSAVRAGDIAEAEATDLVGPRSRSTPHRAQLRTMVVEAWALRHNLTPYDTLYVVLARQLGATLVSTDERLKRAPNLGVQVLRSATDQ